MSDDAPKKKGGKLPIIIALVAVLGGGGFFMTKGKKDAKKEPEIALGKVEVLLPDEFIVNMADGQTYIRAKVALLPKEGFVAEDLKAHDAQLSDIVIRILKSTSPRDVVTDLQITKLKRKIATEINKALHEYSHEEPSKKETTKKKKKKLTPEEEAEEAAAAEEEIPEGWDSAEGPILKVFFKTLATQ